MKLEEAVSKKLNQHLDNIINEYSAGNFDFNDFLQVLSNLISSSENWDNFAEAAHGDFKDYLGDNTQRFVQDLEKYCTANFGRGFLEGKEADLEHDAGSNSKDNEEGNMEEEEGHGVYDNFESEDEDMYAEKNYRRKKSKSGESEEPVERQKSPLKPSANRNQPNRSSNNEGRPSQNNKHGPPPPQNYQVNKGGMPQPNMYQPFQQHPESHMTKQISPPVKMDMSGKMQQPAIPSMQNSNQPAPYPYPYPDYRLYSPMYPYPYPHPMSMMPPPMSMYHPMEPHMMKPPVSEYDPLAGGPKKAPPEIVKTPPANKPSIELKPIPIQPPPNIQKKKEFQKQSETTTSDDERPPTKMHQHSKEHATKIPRHQGGGSNPTAQDEKEKMVESKNAIYVKNIPGYYNTVSDLSKFFKRFGSIVNIKVDHAKKMACVEFQKEADATKALGNRKPLFDNKAIFITRNPDATGPDQPTNGANGPADSGAAAALKMNESLTEKLKFLISLKSFIVDKDKKNELMNRMNDIKAAQKSNKLGELLQKLLETENINLKIDHTILLSNIPKEVLESKTLNSKLDKYGKIEKLKINPKERTAELNYYTPESARKALTEVTDLQIRFLKDESNEVMKKIKAFEDSFLIPAV